MAKREESYGSGVEIRILQTLQDEVLSITQLAKKLGMTRYILAGILEVLRMQGKIKLHKVGKSNVYTLTEEGRKHL